MSKSDRNSNLGLITLYVICSWRKNLMEISNSDYSLMWLHVPSFLQNKGQSQYKTINHIKYLKYRNCISWCLQRRHGWDFGWKPFFHFESLHAVRHFSSCSWSTKMSVVMIKVRSKVHNFLSCKQTLHHFSFFNGGGGGYVLNVELKSLESFRPKLNVINNKSCLFMFERN